MKRGLFIAPFDELVEPRLLAELAAEAERAGWDGIFLWDHIAYREPVEAIADPWIALSAIACATERIRLGPMVTPLSRRRSQKLARETVTLDHLSGGRLILGAGLGSDNPAELEPYGEVREPRERAKLLDQGLADLDRFWSGEFKPPPIQQPRIPVWIAGRYPKRKPMERAARWDGFFPIELPEPAALEEMAAHLAELRRAAGAGSERQLDIVVETDPGADPEPWASAGASWVLTAFGRTPTEARVRAAIAGA